MGRAVFLVVFVAACARTDLVVPDPPDVLDVSDASDAGEGDVLAEVDPLSPCSVQRDVFYFDIEGSGVGYLAGQTIATNLDATWDVTLRPDLFVNLGGAFVVGLSLDSNNDGPSSPGTYSENSANGPWLEIDDQGIACPVTNGTLTIDDLSYKSLDGGVEVTSVLLFFDGQCSPDFSIRGCLRYAASP